MNNLQTNAKVSKPLYLRFHGTHLSMNITTVFLILLHTPVKSYVVKSHSQMEQYFFSYSLTCEVYLIEVLEIMAQMLQYITF